ncbi:hypothetical protein PR048_029160 [Dryococelus australis]|uniref:Uncharacterized protein n=1 Tax=Dryococelus australis TaxID=614101 RepID=A0ABQ9GFD3_9NEOP|nr:hypothetical protein PR048_029160 [Dryococelus australis]
MSYKTHFSSPATTRKNTGALHCLESNKKQATIPPLLVGSQKCVFYPLAQLERHSLRGYRHLEAFGKLARLASVLLYGPLQDRTIKNLCPSPPSWFIMKGEIFRHEFPEPMPGGASIHSIIPKGLAYSETCCGCGQVHLKVVKRTSSNELLRHLHFSSPLFELHVWELHNHSPRTPTYPTTTRGRGRIGTTLGAAVAERLARLPSTKANRAQYPAGSSDFRKWESCRTMPSIGGFSRGYPVSPAPSFRRCSIFTSITLKTSLLRAAQISSPKHLSQTSRTHSFIFSLVKYMVEAWLAISKPPGRCEVVHRWAIAVVSIWAMLGPFAFTSPHMRQLCSEYGKLVVLLKDQQWCRVHVNCWPPFCRLGIQLAVFVMYQQERFVQVSRLKEAPWDMSVTGRGNEEIQSRGASFKGLALYYTGPFPQASTKRRTLNLYAMGAKKFSILNSVDENGLALVYMPSERFGRLLTARSCEPKRVIELSMEQRRNESTRETGDLRENPPTNIIVRHDSHLRKSGDPARGLNPAMRLPLSHRGPVYMHNVSIPDMEIDTNK